MAIRQPVTIQPRPNVKQIGYLSKTFTDFRQNFIEFAKAYYPNTYADFNEASPGMMFIEMASYLGDVLSFYIDNQFKENLLAYAEQPENVVTIAQFLGYKPKLRQTASGTVSLSIIVPRKLDADSGEYIPDDMFLPQLEEGSSFTTNTSDRTRFILTRVVDFRDYLTIGSYEAVSFTSNREPATFVVTIDDVQVIAATRKTVSFGFGSAQRFTTVTMPAEDIVGIESVVDTSGNDWYEVDYLAQDVIVDDVDIAPNTVTPNGAKYKLRLKKVPRRFVTRINRDLRTELLFGSGETNDSDLDVLVDSRQIANEQYGNIIQNSIGNVALNNINFLNSTSFGLAPANTTLTVTYLVGGGLNSNSPAESIVNIENLIIQNSTANLTPDQRAQFNAAIQTVQVTNLIPATGGGDGESLEEVRQNALAFFNAQNRVVTADDYVMRSLSLPSKYGKVAKALAVRDEQINSILLESGTDFVTNPVRPYAINLYTLGYANDGSLTELNSITKENLKLYLEQYRMLTDEINIVDAFIVNIGVSFDVIAFKNYNLNDVAARCIDAVQQYFDITKWNINQPIILSDLTYKLGSIEGVQTVMNVEVTNKYRARDGREYQLYKYDINAATENGIIYPSLDPCIFEIKYPEVDIQANIRQ
jgi:hypothetical protein